MYSDLETSFGFDNRKTKQSTKYIVFSWRKRRLHSFHWTKIPQYQVTWNIFANPLLIAFSIVITKMSVPWKTGGTLKDDPRIHVYNKIRHLYSLTTALGRWTWRLAARDTGNGSTHTSLSGNTLLLTVVDVISFQILRACLSCCRDDAIGYIPPLGACPG